MKCEKIIKKAAYLTAIALLMLLLWSILVDQGMKNGESRLFLSEGAAKVVSIACTALALLAVGGVVFIAIKAFYVGLTEPKSGRKHEDDASRD